MSSNFLKRLWKRIYHVYCRVFVFDPQCTEYDARIKYLKERYKNLRKAKISDIPDEDLEEAVRIWFRSKFNEDGSDEYEVITSLPKPCQNVYSTMTVTDDTMNGGFYQLLFNSTGQFAEMSIEGYLALESPKLSNLVKRAVELYQQNKQVLDARFDALRNGTRNRFFEEVPNELDEAFTKLNEAFFEYDSIDYAKYIRQHINCFDD